MRPLKKGVWAIVTLIGALWIGLIAFIGGSRNCQDAKGQPIACRSSGTGGGSSFGGGGASSTTARGGFGAAGAHASGGS